MFPFKLNTWKVEAARYLWIRGQPGLRSKFQDNHSYTEKHYLEEKEKD